MRASTNQIISEPLTKSIGLAKIDNLNIQKYLYQF